MRKYPTITIRINQDLLDAVNMASKDLDITRSRFIIQAIETKIDHYIQEDLDK